MSDYPLLSNSFTRLGAGLLLLGALSECTKPAGSITPAVDFNQDWQFVKDMDTAVTAPLFTKATDSTMQWATVSLPHTAQVEPVVTDKKQWQGTCFYRKFFQVPATDSSKHVAIHIGAAMHTADVYLNGKKLQRHVGGYLPFTVDVSRQLKFGQENCLLVKLNNQDNPAVPPGKPLKDLDFNFYSGLYRSVQLLVQDKVHVSDAVAANRTAGGGLLLHYENVSPQSATLRLQAEVQNDAAQAQTVQVRATLLDEKGQEVSRIQNEAAGIGAGAFERVDQVLNIANPKLWSPEQPYLYRLVVEVLREGAVVDRQELQTGIRTIRFATDGFYLNGQKLRLRGTNRHQEYPYLGYALSDNAQYRDAWQIREAGFNFVRCSHYPPSPAFLQACDELGILVMNSIPGWQFFGGAEFQKNSLQNVHDMVRRDRNHPSVVLWESSLNETGMSKPYMELTHQAVHQELPWKEGVYTCGWMDYAYDVFIPARQHSKAPDYWSKYTGKKPLFLCEYGDWEYYAQNAGFNQTAYAGLKESERTSRQLRGQGERALAQQALNFQEAHNDNFRSPAVGDANWLLFDYKRGYAPDIESSGVGDIFRLPKFAYYFYQSQYGPVTTPQGFGKPMVYIASYWQPTSSKQVVVYSNCDEVELQLNGTPVARQRPDANKFSDRLTHPPFTFTLPAFTPGTLKAVGYSNGKVAAQMERRTPGAAQRLQLRYARHGKDLTAGQNDAVFVYASVVDANGTVVPDATTAVKFTVQGAELLGNNPVEAEGGIATILLRVGLNPGAVQVSAEAAGLTGNTLEIGVK
ncbi:glycoside hydrolase family 2 protein [Hymenobacter sp.]|jgi:beta-galactosidase|uniref:glycoside hydrolase family 2 protein n=1 Tax=Hymenobacter sp. TaxID=1898978 RepID=UPI002ED8FD84